MSGDMFARYLLLAVTAPLWFPWRFFGWLRWRSRARPTLHLVVSGALPDVAPKSALFGLLRKFSGPNLIALLDTLEHAAADPNVSTLLVRIQNLTCGLGRAEEVRAALCRVKSAGKQVIVHADELGLGGYWLSLGASSIRLAPQGSLNVSGVAMEFTLLKGLLDRAGVRAQLLARGEYKSMREMFTEHVMSDKNREMLRSLVDDLSTQLVSLVAAARSQSPEVARAELDQGPFRADEARARGLIDKTQYWDELWDEVGGENGKVETSTAYEKRMRRKRLLPRRGTRVGLLRIAGNIRSGHDRPGPNGPRATGDASLRRALRQVTKSPQVRAIVVRVDSPGGSALASDLMWRELTLASQKKPMFVSMVNVAASGGYYTSGLKGVGVWANPTTLTGSIGVVGGKFEVSELLSKLGVARETVASGPRASFYSVTTPWSHADLEKIDRDMEALYRDFVAKMAEARGLSHEALDAVARGRVWTGQQAREVGLVDHMGGLFDVKVAVRERLGLAGSDVIDWVVPSGGGRGLFGRRQPDAEADELVARAEPLLRGLPELTEAMGRAIDLHGERLLLLSIIDPSHLR